MARGKSGGKSTPKAKTPKSGKAKQQKGYELNRDEMYGQVDEFMENRDKISLNTQDSEDNEDSETYDVEVSEEDDSESEELELVDVPGEEGSDDEPYEDKRKKAIEEEDNIANAWGKKKNTYYGADTAEYDLMGEDEDDNIQAEEEESRRQQLEAAEGIEEEDLDISHVLQHVVSKKKKSKKKSKKTSKQTDAELLKAMNLDDITLDHEGLDIERIKQDVSKISKADKKELLLTDAPELMGILEDFQPMLAELRDQLAPLLIKIKEKELPTSRGISFLELKYQLLLTYCTNLTFYLMLKAEGKAVKHHPVIKQLATTRAVLEKMKSIDVKLKYQVDKLLKMAKMGPEHSMAGAQDPLSFKPKPSAMNTKGSAEVEEGDEEGLYKPARLMSVQFDANEKAADKRKKKQEKERQKAQRSSIISDLREELYSDRPTEVKSTGGKAKDADLADRERFEEDNFFRLMETKTDKKKRKASNRLRSMEDMDDLEYFGDLNPIKEADDDAGMGGTAFPKKVSMTQKLLADAKKNAPSWNEPEDFGEGEAFYDKMNASQKVSKKKQKEAHPKPQYNYRDTDPNQLEEGKRRFAGNKIVKNRGLTRYRPKESHNPRVAKRKKADDKQSKWKSSNKTYTGKTNDYAGDKSGINTRVIKSTKFK